MIVPLIVSLRAQCLIFDSNYINIPDFIDMINPQTQWTDGAHSATDLMNDNTNVYIILDRESRR